VQACREGLLYSHKVVPRPELSAMNVARQLRVEARATSELPFAMAPARPIGSAARGRLD